MIDDRDANGPPKGVVLLRRQEEGKIDSTHSIY